MLSFTLTIIDAMPPPPRRVKIKLIDAANPADLAPSKESKKVTRTVVKAPPSLLQTMLTCTETLEAAEPMEAIESSSFAEPAPKKRKFEHKAVIMQSAVCRDDRLVFHLTCTCLTCFKETSLHALPEWKRLDVATMMRAVNKRCGATHDFSIPFRLRTWQPS